jgi:hypothetical protein
MKPDRDQLAQFVDALFRYAEEGSFVSLRAFDEHNRGVPPVKIEAVAVNGDLSKLVDRAEAVALLASSSDAPAVFAPPVALFLNGRKAGEKDLSAALAAAAELDHEAQAGLLRLRGILGPPTVVVESGGEWAPGKPKVHAYWRYAEPATGKQLERSKQLRVAMLTLVGGDPTNGPDSHPIRWPGSWHRKGEPRLCRIVELNPDAEIEIDDVIDDVIAACKAEGKSPRQARVNGGGGRPIDPGTVDPVRFAALMDMSDNFARAWRERFYKEDGTTPDHSKCDWHLGMEAAAAGWTDEEVAALIQAFRSKVGEGDKATPRYLGHTIQKIRDGMRGGERRYDPDIAKAEEASESGDTKASLAALSNRLGVPIEEFYIVGREGEPSSNYILDLSNGTSVTVGSPSDLLTQAKVRALLLGACNVVMRGMKQHEWDTVVSLLIAAAKRKDPGDSNRVVQIKAAVEDYVSSRKVLPEWKDEGSWNIFRKGEPMTKNGVVGIKISNFVSWATLKGMRVTEDETRQSLTLLGWSGKQWQDRIEGKNIKRWYWSGDLQPTQPDATGTETGPGYANSETDSNG